MVISKTALDNLVEIVLDTEDRIKRNEKCESDIKDMIMEIKSLALKAYRQENKSRKSNCAKLIVIDKRLGGSI